MMTTKINTITTAESIRHAVTDYVERCNAFPDGVLLTHEMYIQLINEYYKIENSILCKDLEDNITLDNIYFYTTLNLKYGEIKFIHE